jgi:uncharacterized protein (UPF0332 family)
VTIDQAESAAYIERAVDALHVARELNSAGHYGDAASRAYYAVFYAATAALRRQGLTASRHGAVIALVNQHLVKPGTIDKESGRLLNWLFELRTAAD